MEGEHRGQSRLQRWAPGAACLRRYRREWLRGDVVAGLTVGALLITQCMAYAPIAGLPPSAAFQAAIIGIPLYALLGSSKHLAIGPDPGTATLAAAGLSAVAVAGSAEYVTAAGALAVLVGLVLLLASALRLGFLADLLSRPALVGYLAGLGITLFISQIGKLSGIPIESDGVLGRLGDALSGVGDADRATTAMGLGTLAVILVLKRWAPRVPAALAGVVVALVVAWVGGLDDHGIALVGDLDARLPGFSFPSLPAGDWLTLIGTAGGVALVGYADSILTARGVADQRGDRLDANRELSGLGVANVAAGLFRGMPLSSTGSGTAAMSSAGGNTSLGGIVAAASVALGIVAFPGVLERIPVAALAAVVVVAAIGLIESRAFLDLWRVSRAELVVAVATCGAVVFTDVLVGVVVSVVLSLAVALFRMSRPHDAVLGNADELDGWVDATRHPSAATTPGLLVYRFDAPLLFTNANRYSERVLEVTEENPGDESWVVLDLEGVGSIDATAVMALRRLVVELRRRGVETVAVARPNAVVEDRLDRAGLLAEGLLVYATIRAAVRAYDEMRRAREL